MRDLLKADLKRVFKDKLFIILSILAIVFALSTPLLYKALFSAFDIEEMPELEMFGIFITAKSMFFTSFSPGNNFGIILPIMLAIVLCKDFSQGTIRNKIVSGKSRTSVYFSLLITCVIYMCAFILVQALITLAVSLIFFEYQSEAFTFNDFGYLMASIGFEMLVYVFISALLVFFIILMKSSGLSIVMYFALNFTMLIVGAIMQTAMLFIDTTHSAYGILEFIITANVFSSTAIGGGITYELKEILALLLPNIVFTATFIMSGLLIFKKKDLK